MLLTDTQRFTNKKTVSVLKSIPVLNLVEIDVKPIQMEFIDTKINTSFVFHQKPYSHHHFPRKTSNNETTILR